MFNKVLWLIETGKGVRVKETEIVDFEKYQR